MATKKITVRVHPNAPDTFRRAGFTFTRDAQTVTVTSEQEDAIRADPLLIVAGPPAKDGD